MARSIRARLPEWEFAFQSLVCPIGFVADHLEILYDLDVEAQQFARSKGILIRRTASFNTRPEFIDALAQVVRDVLPVSASSTGRDLPPASR